MLTANNPAPIAQLREPRGFVTINNVQVPWERFEISNTRYSASGTFRITLPASSLPRNLTLADLVANPTLTVQVNAGVPLQTNPNNATPSDLPLLILGEADEIVYEPDKTMVTISGRDYIARFLDNKLNQLGNTVGNQIQSILSYSKSSDIITIMAKNRGLTPVVTQTSQNIGTYLQTGYSFLSSQITEWDLMTFLAREEGYDIYVQGLNLYFQPKQTSNPYQITLTIPYFMTQGSIPTSNAIEIQLTRNLRLAKDIVVQVTTWNISDKTTYTKVATLKHNGSAGGTNIPIVYNYRFPNLTPEQTQLKAQQLLQEISQHEMIVNVKMPADDLVTAHTQLLVKDTSTLFDQIFYVKNVTREMDFGGGYMMHMEAKTIPPYVVTFA